MKARNMEVAWVSGLTQDLLRDFSEDVGWGYSHLKAQQEM